MPRYPMLRDLPRSPPEPDPIDRLFAAPVAAFCGAVVAGMMVVMANLAALVFDVLMMLVLSPLTLSRTLWSFSPQIFVAIWLATMVGALVHSPRGVDQ